MARTNPLKKAAASQVRRNLSDAAEDPRFDLASRLLEAPTGRLAPEQIQPRPSSTREVDDAHVDALSESIGALGLIEPIVVDRNNRLLAGEHRLSAILKLKETNEEQYKHWFSAGVPVQVLDFDANTDEQRALEVEIAENEHRRDYTRAEVRVLAERLRSAGYHDTRGRPKRGIKALGPALRVIIGKSAPTIRKLLAEEDEATTPKAPSHPLSPLQRSLNRTFHKHEDAMPGHIKTLYGELIAALSKEISDG